ncbi:hypothetical protein GH714_009103 [Hevea brasiliensis]|uniref:Myosin motor domain-containing protein n=1 Tax=Hevea brasiliensis TaxID=3981 RepID=A0A6A6KAM2_HEVBR|nr:hypothetical protein GH714_009103 [Hevea brasiliensis]
MMLSASPAAVARSSLEEMLDSLRRRDEALEKTKELPPALPARPTSRARLPSARHSLPTDFMVGANGQMESKVEIEVNKGKEDTIRKEKQLGNKTGSFGSKKMRKDQNCVDSNPYSEEKNEPAKGPVIISMPNAEEPEWEDNIGYFIKKKLRIWCQLANGRWGSGNIQSTSGDEAVVLLSGGNFVKVSTADLLPANPDILEGVDDLMKLSYLNEPSVFTILSTDILRIWFIGESGAGKTETAKHAMQYLANLGGGIGGIEHEILQTNCILEAFGNAKTSRNDNSSRFGKLIEIHFSTLGKICGAKIQTCKHSRVVQLAKGERSYHIFYQLCAGAPSILRERLNLKMASEYNYLNQSECLVIDGVDDALNFHKLMEALDIVQICKADQEQTFAMLAAILWLGNVSFQVIGNENHVEVLADEAITNAARLMGCSIQDLTLALSTHKIRCGKDDIVKKLTFQQAIDRRDALAKFIFASLFDWLVDQINKSLGVGKLCTGRSINILDIYGFESFMNNSFEQFCINYANERLQQHFNRHLFKLEQEDYEEDGIDWTKVDFDDNQECLNLFEKKPLGLLSLLDEESNFPNATDFTFANKLTALEQYGFLLLGTNVSQDPLSISVAVLQQFNVAPEMYQVGYTKVFLRTGQIAKLEELRKRVQQGILGVQKCFRGSQARRDLNKLKQGVTILQSFVRGENGRRKYKSMPRSCTVNATLTVDIDNKLVAIICLQSVIRGWLARKQFNDKYKLIPNSKRKLGRKISEVKT